MSASWRRCGLFEKALGQKGVFSIQETFWSIVLGISGAIACTSPRALAQIVPDTTLPINSVVTTNGNTQTITGGTQAGTNLFHSFDQFSVVTGSTASFNHPLTIQNIISRVTGSSISNIDGLIQANGTANLFLINPNGLIFGPYAALNIGGSFVGSTASSIQFADGTQFSARNPTATPLLTISVPIGLQFNGTEGNIAMRAGNASSKVVTETGDAGQLLNTAQPVSGQPSGATLSTISGSLSDVNDVDLYQIHLNGDKAFSASTIGGSAVDTQLFLFDANGMGIYANDDRDGTFQSTIPSLAQPVSLTSSGTYYLGISSYDNDPFSSGGYIFGSDYATGPGAAAPLSGWDDRGYGRGAYTITLKGAEFATPNRFQVQPGKTLALVGGQVSLEGTVLRVPGSQVELGGLAAPGTVKLNFDPGSSNLRSLTFPDGVARADVSIASTPTNDTTIDVSAGGGGSIAINARNIDISAAFVGDPNNFYDRTSTRINAGIARGQGFPGTQAGDIIFNATGTVTTSLFTFILNDVVTGAVGNGGNVTIKAGTLSLNSSQFGTGTFGQGNAGNVLLDINDSAFISTTIFSNVFFPGVGDSGSITVKAGSLVLDDAVLSTGTRAQANVPGNAGNILLDVRGPISLRDSRLYSNVNPDAFGNGGNITIRAGSLSLSEESGFATQTEGRGNAGSIIIEAPGGNVSIDQGVILSRVLPGAVGNGGDISIEARSVTLTGGAGLFTNTSGAGNAGNIQIKATNSVSISGAGSFYPGLFGDFDGPSGLFTRTESANRGGDILITTNALHVADTGILDARTIAHGDAGNINVTSNTVTVQNQAQVSTATLSTAPNAGRGGALTMKTGQLLVQNGSLSAETQGTGRGGTLSVNATDSIQLSGEGGLFARASNSGNAGSLRINTGQLTVNDGAQATVSSTGMGTAGNLDVTASSVIVSDRAKLTAETVSGNSGGNITLENLDRLQVINGKISASTVDGRAGNLSVKARNSVQLSGTGSLSVEATGSGSAGSLTVNTRQLTLQEGAKISASTVSGTGGDITLQNLDNLQLRNSSISASTQQGTAGDVTVNARNTVQLSGEGGLRAEATEGGHAGSLRINTGQLTANDGAQATVSSTGTGTAGNLDVTASSVIVSARAKLTAETISGNSGGNITLENLDRLQVNNGTISASTIDGRAGSLSVNTRDSIQLSGMGGLSVEATGTGSAGSLTVNTRQLTLQQGAKISASTVSGVGGDITLQDLDSLQVRNAEISASTVNGRAGSLNVSARDTVQLSGMGGLTVEATDGGTAGNLTVVTDQLTVRDGANVTVSSPLGQAGNLAVTANSVFLNRGSITAVTGKGQGEGGANITLRVPDLLLMRNESLISASALGTANGGNINIDTGFLVALPPQGSNGSDITANAFRGNGGRVNLTAQGIFGIEFRPRLTPLNDITASSEFGLNGSVQINTLGIDPNRGLAELPTDIVDATGLLDRRCTPYGKTGQRSSFTITGRGGLPPSPNGPLMADTVEAGWVSLDSKAEIPPSAASNAQPISSPPKQLVEAQGWIFAPDGRVILTTQAPTATAQHPWQTLASCQTLSNSSENFTASPR